VAKTPVFIGFFECAGKGYKGSKGFSGKSVLCCFEKSPEADGLRARFFQKPLNPLGALLTLSPNVSANQPRPPNPQARTCFDTQPIFRLQTFVRNLLPEKQSLAQIEPDGVARLGTLITYPSSQV